jgi:hypothetical protein
MAEDIIMTNVRYTEVGTPAKPISPTLIPNATSAPTVDPRARRNSCHAIYVPLSFSSA